MEVIFVGISNKSDKNGKDIKPFDENTQSGKILLEIENRIQKKTTKTNLVPFTPTDSKGKIRYPNKSEIDKHFPECLNFLIANTPCLVFLLGKIVEQSFLKKIDYTDLGDGVYKLEGKDVFLSPIEHPSYIAVYKRKQLSKYLDKINDIINKYNHS